MIEIIPNWHPIFVHFTVALLSVTTGLYLLSLLVADGGLKEQWRIVGRWSLWFGMGFTILTIISGWYAYNTVVHDTPSHLAMTEHRNWALATAGLFLAATIWSILSYQQGQNAPILLLVLLVVSTAALGTTAWRGGELVYRHGLGVLSLPNTSNHGHMTDESNHVHRTSSDENTRQQAHPHEEGGVIEREPPETATSHEHQGGSPPHAH